MFLKLLKSIEENKITILSFFLLFFIVSAYSQQGIKVKNLKLNNKLNHFAPVMSKGKVYFSRNKLNSKGKPIKTRFGGYMYSLLKANVDTQGVR